MGYEEFSGTQIQELMMARCKFCGMDSVDLTWTNIEPNQQKPPVYRLYFQGKQHNCKKEPEAMKVCPYCDPLTRQPMPIKKLQRHLKTEHLEWYLGD